MTALAPKALVRREGNIWVHQGPLHSGNITHQLNYLGGGPVIELSYGSDSSLGVENEDDKEGYLFSGRHTAE